MKGIKKLKKRKRPGVSKEHPLHVAGRLSSVIYQEHWSNGLWGIARSLIRLLPSFRNTQGGRQNASLIRLLFFGTAFVILGLHIELWPISAILGLCGLPLPIRRSRKTLWLSQVDEKRKPRPISCFEDGKWEYDGRKVSLRRNGLVERSLRPGDEPTTVVIENGLGGAWVGLIPKKETRKRTIWVTSEGTSLAPYLIPKGTLPPEAPESPLLVSSQEIQAIALHFAELEPLQPDEIWP